MHPKTVKGMSHSSVALSIITHTQGIKHAGERPTLALKPRGEPPKVQIGVPEAPQKWLRAGPRVGTATVANFCCFF